MTTISIKSAIALSCSLLILGGCSKDSDAPPEKPYMLVPAEKPFATGLKSPIGIAEDAKGNIWVAEAGSGNGNDGQVTVITPAGEKHPAITGFLSKMSPENSPEGLNHLAIKDGILYVLHGVDEKLYMADVSKFEPGTSKVLKADSIDAEDIGTFVRNAHPNAPDPKDSNPYDLAFGPNGDLFITDAGGNALVHRDKGTKELSIFAVFDDVPNPTHPSKPVGPPTLDAVPTGIISDGTNLYVGTLLGFPFPEKLSQIFKIDPSKPASEPVVHKKGFSAITDLTYTRKKKLLVSEFGFANNGRITDAEDTAKAILTPAITPVDLILSAAPAETYYLLQYGPGNIIKLTPNQ